jgi:glutamine---fructose-6-phosphate transaminase (isomerizing)
MQALSENRTLEEVREKFARDAEWLFVGCGSSYYLGLSAAATMTLLGRQSARAVPASEILLYPDLALRNDCIPVLISRSGRTSEVLQVAELLAARRISALAISCAPGQPLEELATFTIILPPADEQSTVMTRSFTSMLLTLQVLAGLISSNAKFSESLPKTCATAASVLQSLPKRIQEFVAAHNFADYVSLGQGPFYGLACESALKITEMSVSYAQSFHTLEFRHGPKSIISPDTLTLFLLSESGHDAEVEVLEEVKSLGGTTLVVTNCANARVRAGSDLLIEQSLDVPELARLGPYMFAGQLLGLYAGLKKGLDPDSPRHLSRVVILEKGTSPKEPEPASR